MTPTQRVLTAVIVSGVAQAVLFAQVAPGATQPPATAAAEVTACAQAQVVVDGLLANAYSRLELARQSNNPAEMRAAIDALQTTIRDVRAQLVACAKVGAADPHPGHASPGVTTMPRTTATSGSKPSEPAMAQPSAPAKPLAADPHAGHTTPPSKPAPKTTTPVPAKPPATDPHAGHTSAPPAKPATAKPAAKPASPAKPPAAADAHAGHGAPAPAAPASRDAKAIDPVCGLRVDPSKATSTTHGGQTYYFCSTRHRELFVKEPAKFLPGKH